LRGTHAWRSRLRRCANPSAECSNTQSTIALMDPFWRFPHRNRLLGRQNTRAQKAWLRERGVRYGQ